MARFWHSKFFYRKIIVIGRENINPDDYLIFAPNHQNALMDPLAVLFTQKGQPVFLARADIFKNRFIASILYFLKILPVYRIRDGFSTLKENDRVFEKTIDVLKHKNGLVILPEGNHEGTRRLRQLKKGICRIAFQTEEATGFTLNIKIVPVGIEFSHYHRIRQVLTVVYGKPIKVMDYRDLYLHNPGKAINELKERLSDEMKKVMVHIETTDDYEAVDELRNIVNGKYCDDIKVPKLFRDRALVGKLNNLNNVNPALYRKICNLSLSVKKRAGKLGTDYRLLEKRTFSLPGLIAGTFALLLALPVFLYGIAFNFIFYPVPELIKKKIRDKQFYSTVIYTVSFFLAVLLLPVYLLISILLISPFWLALIIFVTIPVAGLVAWSYKIFFSRVRGGWRIRKYISEKNKDFLKLKKEHEELISIINTL